MEGGGDTGVKADEHWYVRTSGIAYTKLPIGASGDAVSLVVSGVVVGGIAGTVVDSL